MAISTSTLPGRICRSMSRVISFGARAPGTSTAPMSRSTVGNKLTRCASLENKRVGGVHRDVEKTHPLQIDFENGHIGARVPWPS